MVFDIVTIIRNSLINEVIYVCCGDLVLQIVNIEVQFQTAGPVDKFKFYLSFFSRCNYLSDI